MGRKKLVKRTPAEARSLKRARNRALAYYASESQVRPKDPATFSGEDGIEQEDGIVPVPVEDAEADEFDMAQSVDHEPEVDDECEPEPGASACYIENNRHARDIPTRRERPIKPGRDLSNMEDFDWEGAKSFAAHPDTATGLSEREEKSFLCYNHPNMTRALWDDFIKPLVDATVAEFDQETDWKLNSFKGMRTQLRTLAPGMEPSYVDACRGHCCVFNNPLATRGEKCPHCGLQRRDKYDKPYATTAIFPLKNLLRAQLLDNELRKEMIAYRDAYQKAFETEQVPNTIEDFWDGEEVRRMMKKGGLLSSPAVIALTISGDSAEYAKSPAESVTPYMVLNQNMPPSIRYKHELVLALHAGEAKDDSVWVAIFNALLDDEDDPEAEQASLGLYYGETEFKFQICMATGDYPFAAACLGVCSHAGRRSCRICYATGYRVKKGYYLVPEEPYDEPEQDKHPMKFPYEPFELGQDQTTLRNWEEYKSTIALAGSVGTTAWKDIRLQTGISARGSIPPALVRHLQATDVPIHRLIPIDPMHAMSLNVIKIMMQFITAKDKDMVNFDFCLPKNHMDGFFEDLMACTKDIPEELMRRPMVDFRKSSARAEHFVAIGRLAPILLAGRLPEKYMGAITQAAYLLDDMSKLRLSQDDVEQLNARVVKFQEEFYGEWYGGMVLRVPMCRTYFHTIAHLPDAIRAWGPPFVFSQYAMERLNGRVIKMARANGKTPIRSSSNRIARESMVERIKHRPEKQTKNPITGLRLRLDSVHFVLTKAEKRALAIYVKSAPEDVPESVYRYARFRFEFQLDYHKVSASLFRSSPTAIKRECRYAYCSDTDYFVDVLSLFEYKGEELAFVHVIKMDKIRWDQHENEYLENWESCWGSRITVINCNQITTSVAFIRNSVYPSRRYLVRNLRIYDGDRYYEEEGETNAPAEVDESVD